MAGVAVVVRGKTVAWFALWTEDARDWCSENHFGEWLVFPAEAPVITPISKERYREACEEAEKINTLFKELPICE